MTETTRDLVITTGELYDILSRPGVTIEGLRLVVMHWPKDRARLCASRSAAPSEGPTLQERAAEALGKFETQMREQTIPAIVEIQAKRQAPTVPETSNG